MARRVFYSFHYKPDNWRASQIRNMGIVESDKPATDNDWETITKKGDAAIEKWIKDQMYGKSCAVVLIGTNTAGRKWINYEVKEAWNSGKGLLGIYIHGLKNVEGQESSKGSNPFAGFTVGGAKTDLSSIVKAYDPPYTDSKDAYDYIKRNLADWIEHAIEIRPDIEARYRVLAPASTRAGTRAIDYRLSTAGGDHMRGVPLGGWLRSSGAAGPGLRAWETNAERISGIRRPWRPSSLSTLEADGFDSPR